jgi:hypothetical protein
MSERDHKFDDGWTGWLGALQLPLVSTGVWFPDTMRTMLQGNWSGVT